MRVIANIATLPIRRHIEEWDDRAQVSKVVQQGIIAEFEQGLITEYELELGYKHLGPFKGLPTYEDEVTTVSPRKLIRVYDTDQRAEAEHWTKKTHEFVDEFLRNHELNGTNFIIVETPKRPAPWPAYDKLTGKTADELAALAERIALKVIEDEYDPAEVLAYERDNANRDAVTAALEHLVPVAESKPFNVEDLVLDA